MTWPPTTHQHVSDEVSLLRSGAAGVYYVSKTGNDSNDGKSWATAKLTVASALTALGAGAGNGKVFIGAGTFDEAIPSWTTDKTLIGSGIYSTILRLTSTGTFLDFNAENDCGMRDLCLAFSSASVTGTLVRMDNSFKHRLFNVRFLGTGTAGQVGLDLLNNSGDSHYIACKFESLGIGIRTVTSDNLFSHCHITGCLTGLYGGDPTDTDDRGGISMRDSHFIGTGNYYVDLDGSGLTFNFDNCWFDGGATTAVKIGKADGTLGPENVNLSSQCLFGATTSLLLYKATGRINLVNVNFHHGGTPPTELSIPTPANVPRGSVINVRSNQGAKIESLVPDKWDGWRGYFTYDSNKTQGYQTNAYMDVGSFRTYRRVVIRITGRLSGDPQTVITFPSAFETGERYKTFDNTGFTGITLSGTALTIPTGNAGSGLIVVEGF